MLSRLSFCLFASGGDSPRSTAAATSGCRGDRVLRSGWRLLATCGVRYRVTASDCRCMTRHYPPQVAAGPCVAAAVYILGWGGDVTPMQVAPPFATHPSLATTCYSSIHSFVLVLLQLLLTGVVLAASAIVASAAAARFWERHTAMQLLGIEAAPPDPLWAPAVPFKSSFDYSKAAVDFAVGLFSGCTGAVLHLLRKYTNCSLQNTG